MVEAVTSYTWPTLGLPIARGNFRVADLAGRLGVALQSWREDGLGPAQGFGFRVRSGRVYLVQELEFAVRYHGVGGPLIHADASEIVLHGVMVLVDEVIAELGLSEADLLSGDQKDIENLARKLDQ